MQTNFFTNQKFLISLPLFLINIFIYPSCTPNIIPGSEKVVERRPDKAPEWIYKIPENRDGFYFFRGIATSKPKLEEGFDESRRMAIAQIIEMNRSKGMVNYEKVYVSTGDKDTYAELVNNGMKLLAKNITKGTKETESYYEKVMKAGAGGSISYFYNVYVLIKYPENAYKSVMNETIDEQKKEARQRNDRKAENFLETMGKEF